MIGWKETLAAQTEGIATYLSLALHNWQLRHNDSPDLSADVTVEIRGDQGTVILSRRQATWLAESLELMHLRGTVRVQVADPERARIPNRHIAIVVNGEPMTIPPDPSAALEPFDVGPVVLVAQAAWFLGAAMPGQPESALGAVAIPALGSLSLAAWSFRHKERLGEVAHGPLIVGALGLGILQTALATATMRSPRAPSGLRRFPAAAALIGPCILASLYWSDLTKAYRVAAAALAGSSVLVGYALTPDSLRLTDVISEVIWPASAAASAVRLPMTLRADAARLRASLREAESERLESAFNEGQQLVIRLVSGAHQRAQHALEENRAFLDPKMADEASQRLRQIARQLRAMK
jgi:hypothetical protein